MAKLTSKQLRFAKEYIIDRNVTQAAIRAGYPPRDAKRYGKANLEKPKIQELTGIADAEPSRRRGIIADMALEELAKLAFANPMDLIDIEDGSVRADASREAATMISSIKVKRSGGQTVDREIKFYDKLKALELLAKLLGIFDDKADAAPDLNLKVTIDYN